MVTIINKLQSAVDLTHRDIVMEPYLNLSRPYNLIEGEHYIYIDMCSGEPKLEFLDVQFIAYTSCPAIVIVLDGSGQKVRVLREELYVSGDSQNVIRHMNQVGVPWTSA